MGLLLGFCLNSPLNARDWSDLEEPQLIGSSKEGRVTNFVLGSFENWTNERNEKRQSLHLFFLFHATWYPKYNATTFFPLYHRLSSKIDTRRKTIVFPLFWRTYEDDQNDFLLTPLTYYNLDHGDSTTIVGPYLMWWKNYRYQDRLTYRGFGLLPLFHLGTDYTWNDGRTEVDERSLFLFPLLSYFEWSEHRSLQLLPVLPFIYYRKTDENHSSDGSFTSNRKTFLIPFYKSSYETERGSTWTFNIFPLVYTSGRSFGEDDRGLFTHLFPLFYYDSSRDASHREKIIYFPSLPFLFYSKSYETSDLSRSTFYLFPYYKFSSSGSDPSLNESSHALIPFYSYSASHDRSLLWIFPTLFFRSNDTTGSSTSMVFPFFYRSYEAPTTETEEQYAFWLFPFYRWKDNLTSGSHLLPFYWYERGTDSDKTMITPLYWSSRTGETEKQFGFPFYYSSKWKEDVLLTDEAHRGMHEKRDYSTFWLLNYYSWNHTKSEGFLLFPFRYRSSDRLKEYDLYIPLTFSTNQSLAKIDSSGIYLDSDYSFAYDIVSISTRIALIDRRIPGIFKRTDSPEIFNPDAVDTKTLNPGQKTQDAQKEDGPQVVRGKDADPFDRTNTGTYLGWRVLFGWTSYVRADTKRHFRLLPLAWLSWDEKDENDSMTFWLIPGYLNYQSEDVHYRAIFPALLPVYGAFDQKGSRIRVYGGPAYITSYDDETKESEVSVLWPFFKWYDGPEESGHRLFPLYSARTFKTEQGERSRSFSWIHYGSSRTQRTEDGLHSESSFLSPFYLSSETLDQRTAGDSYRSSYHFFPFPLLTHIGQDQRDHYNLLFLSGMGRSDDGSFASTYVLPLYYSSRTATPKGDRTSLWIANLYHRMDNPEQGYRESDYIWPIVHTYERPGEYGWWILPLLGYNHLVEGDASEKSETTSHFSFLHYASETVTGGKHSAVASSFWLLNLYHSETYMAELATNDDRWMIWPLFRRLSESIKGVPGCTETETRYRLYPVVYYTYEGGTKPCGKPAEHTFFMLPAWYLNRTQETSTDFFFGYYRKSGEGYGFHNLLYLADFEYDSDSTELGLAFHTIEYRTRSDGHRFKLLWGLAAEWETYSATTGKYARESGYDFRFINYIQRNNSHDYGSEFKTALWPVFSYYTDEDESSFWFLPTLSYHERRDSYVYDNDGAYLLWYRERNEQSNTDSNYILSGILYRHYREYEQGYKSRGSLWGWIWEYETEDETGYEKFSILKGLIYRQVTHPQGNRKYAKALIFIPIYDESIR